MKIGFSIKKKKLKNSNSKNSPMLLVITYYLFLISNRPIMNIEHCTYL